MSIHFELIHTLSNDQKIELLQLYHNEWWSKNRTAQDLDRILEHSTLIFGYALKENQRLIGFARVLTDFYKYGYIYDVIIDPIYRKTGLGRTIVQAIVNHPKLSDLKSLELTCIENMTSFYEQFGFSKNYGLAIPMRRANPQSKND